MGLITVKEYSERLGIDSSAVRHKIARGNVKTAVKMGRDWVIDEDEPYVDHRITHGKTVGYRKRKAQNPE